jgi:AbrB family looped-hinge helix DNA binding protein
MTESGQVTIPKPARDALGPKPGQRIEFELGENEIALRPAPAAETNEEAAGRLEKLFEEWEKHPPLDWDQDVGEYMASLREPLP